MQISTRTQDYVIDAIELRDKLHILNESFTNPKIVKVRKNQNLKTANWFIIWSKKKKPNVKICLVFYCKLNHEESNAISIVRDIKAFNTEQRIICHPILSIQNYNWLLDKVWSRESVVYFLFKIFNRKQFTQQEAQN